MSLVASINSTLAAYPHRLRFPHLWWHFLIVVVAYLKYHDITTKSSKTSRLTVTVFHQLFSQHGVSEMNVSDNWAWFTSLKFGKFCEMNMIKSLLLASPLPLIEWAGRTLHQHFQLWPRWTEMEGRCGSHHGHIPAGLQDDAELNSPTTM